jgi:hypothetical protein
MTEDVVSELGFVDEIRRLREILEAWIERPNARSSTFSNGSLSGTPSISDRSLHSAAIVKNISRRWNLKG